MPMKYRFRPQSSNQTNFIILTVNVSRKKKELIRRFLSIMHLSLSLKLTNYYDSDNLVNNKQSTKKLFGLTRLDYNDIKSVFECALK